MSIYDIAVATTEGQPASMADYRGKVLLIVNTATQCGLAPHFNGLQRLYERYKDSGFVVLGFPCSQFRNQELERNEDIAAACSLNYGVTFPLFAKVDVIGGSIHPLFRHLTHEAPGLLGIKAIKWNFTKFLVGPDGRVRKRYGPAYPPDKIEPDVKALLHEGIDGVGMSARIKL